MKSSFLYLVNCPSDDTNLNPRKEETDSLLMPPGECTGSLILKHSNAEAIGDYRKIYLSEKNEYVNIRRKFPILKVNIVLGLEAEGNCCWELFPVPKYRGKKSQEIWPEHPRLPEFIPISAKKKTCDERR